jgi:hypothetical protein
MHRAAIGTTTKTRIKRMFRNAPNGKPSPQCRYPPARLQPSIGVPPRPAPRGCCLAPGLTRVVSKWFTALPMIPDGQPAAPPVQRMNRASPRYMGILKTPQGAYRLGRERSIPGKPWRIPETQAGSTTACRAGAAVIHFYGIARIKTTRAVACSSAAQAPPPPMQATPLRVVRLASAATGAGRTCPYRYLTDGTADAGGPGLPPGVPVRQVTGRPRERPPRSEHGGKAWR